MTLEQREEELRGRLERLANSKYPSISKHAKEALLLLDMVQSK